MLDAATHARAKEVFLAAVALPKDARVAFVAETCADDLALRDEVLSLLFHHEGALDLELPSAEGPPEVVLAAEDPLDPLGLAGVTLDGRYLVDRFVAEGGFGYVYRATQVAWGRRVAVKVLKQIHGGEAEAKLRQALIKEGAILNELSRKSLGIVQSHDVSTWRDPLGRARTFIVLEWLEGRTLAAALAQEQHEHGPTPWPLDRIVATLAPIAEALAVAHESGVAHRDVKPENIFLTDDGRAKLLDFGVAKVAAGDGFLATGTGVAPFTVRYAAPEQFDRRWGVTGPWTDVYGLAVTIVELLLGRHPIPTASALEAYWATCDLERRPTPRTHGATLPDALEAVFARALAVHPTERHPDARTFWQDLTAHRP